MASQSSRRLHAVTARLLRGVWGRGEGGVNSVGGQDLMGGVGVLVRGGVGVGVGRRGVFGGKGRKGDGWYVRGEGGGIPGGIPLTRGHSIKPLAGGIPPR